MFLYFSFGISLITFVIFSFKALLILHFFLIFLPNKMGVLNEKRCKNLCMYFFEKSMNSFQKI
jgi:hypothetical protein